MTVSSKDCPDAPPFTITLTELPLPLIYFPPASPAERTNPSFALVVSRDVPCCPLTLLIDLIRFYTEPRKVSRTECIITTIAKVLVNLFRSSLATRTTGLLDEVYTFTRQAVLR